MLFPAGATLKNIIVKMRANNGDVDSVQFHARVHDVDLLDDTLTIDSNGEVGAVDINTLTFNLDEGPRDSLDLQVRIIPLNDYTFNDIGDLHFYCRAAVGSLTGNRQLRCTVIVEWELP